MSIKGVKGVCSKLDTPFSLHVSTVSGSSIGEASVVEQPLLKFKSIMSVPVVCKRTFTMVSLASCMSCRIILISDSKTNRLNKPNTDVVRKSQGIPPANLMCLSASLCGFPAVA